MARLGSLLHLVSSVAFVASGAAFIITAHEMPRLASLDAPDRAMLALTPAVAAAPLAGISLPQIFLHPHNVVMWGLLLSLWVVVILDAVSEWREPTRLAGTARQPARASVQWWMAGVLAVSAVWPWVFGAAPLLAASGAVLGTAAAFHATVQAEGQRRPAIGFLAGWSLGLATALLASELGKRLGMSLAQIAVLATLPAAGFGMAAQLRLGRRIGYSVALIWAFCGLATTTMGASPMTAIAAILGIAAMATVLIRAAS